MNLYIVPSYVGLLLSLTIGAYVLYENPKKRLNRVFFAFSMCSVLWTLAEFMRRANLGVASPAFWSIVENIGVIFIAPLMMHFVSLLVETTNPPLLRKRYLRWGIYGAGLAFLVLLLTGNLIGETTLQYWGYDYGIMPAYYLFAIYYLGLLVAAVVRLSSIFWQTESDDVLHKQIKFVLLGSIVAVTLGGTTDIVLPLANVVIVPLASIGVAIFDILVGYAILRYKMFTISPVTRFLIPMPEARLTTNPKYKLSKGGNYMVEEREPNRIIEIFVDQITHGVPGLWVTSLHQNKIKEHGLGRTPVVFISQKPVQGEVVLHPSDLNRVKEFVENTCSSAKEEVAVMIDCFEEFVAMNGFNRAIEFIQELGKICSKNVSKFIVRVNPDKLNEKQMAAMRKVLVPVDMSHG